EKDVPPEVLYRYGTLVASGPDHDLGRALLAHLPQLRDDQGDLPPREREDAMLRGFLERLVAVERGRAKDHPAPQAAAVVAPERRRKREDEEPSMHDGLDVHTLYHQLAAAHLRLDGQE